MASSKGINPTLLSAFNAMKAAAAREGISIGIGSGYRTVDEQIRLRRTNGCPDVWKSPASSCRIPTAIPGRSNHNHGLAIDFSGNDEADAWVARNAGKFGLHLPVKGENWHLELIDGDKIAKNAGAAVGFGFANEVDKANPEDELASRVHAIMRVVGMGQTDTALPEDLIGLEGADMPEEQLPGVPDDTISINVDTQMSDPAGAPAGGGEFQNAKGGPKAAYQGFARNKLQSFGWSEQEMNALAPLWERESNWNPNAQNPSSTAFGIAQFLNGTWSGTGMKKTADPYKQILAGLTYIKGRYGSPSKAWEFWQKHNWY